MAQYDHLNSGRNTPYGAQPTNPSPYGSGDPYYNESSGYITPQPAKKGMSNWIKIGIPVGVLVIAGAVVGGILGTRHSSSSAAGKTAGASAAASAAKEIGIYATSTNSEFMMPVYPSTVSNILINVVDNGMSKNGLSPDQHGCIHDANIQPQ